MSKATDLVRLKADYWYREIHKTLNPLTAKITASSLPPSVGVMLKK